MVPSSSAVEARSEAAEAAADDGVGIEERVEGDATDDIESSPPPPPSSPSPSLSLAGRALEAVSHDLLIVECLALGGLAKPMRSDVLRCLDLSRNKLIELPAAVLEAVPMMEVLDVSRNQLRELPQALGTLR